MLRHFCLCVCACRCSRVAHTISRHVPVDETEGHSWYPAADHGEGVGERGQCEQTCRCCSLFRLRPAYWTADTPEALVCVCVRERENTCTKAALQAPSHTLPRHKTCIGLGANISSQTHTLTHSVFVIPCYWISCVWTRVGTIGIFQGLCTAGSCPESWAFKAFIQQIITPLCHWAEEE